MIEELKMFGKRIDRKQWQKFRPHHLATVATKIKSIISILNSVAERKLKQWIKKFNFFMSSQNKQFFKQN